MQLGIENFLETKTHGRHRGPNPVRTESQVKALEKLSAKLHSKSGKLRKGSVEEEEEESVGFDIMSKERVILLEGKVPYIILFLKLSKLLDDSHIELSSLFFCLPPSPPSFESEGNKEKSNAITGWQQLKSSSTRSPQ